MTDSRRVGKDSWDQARMKAYSAVVIADPTLKRVFTPYEGFCSRRQLAKFGKRCLTSAGLAYAKAGPHLLGSKLMDLTLANVLSKSGIGNFMIATLTDSAVDAVYEKLLGADFSPTIYTNHRLGCSAISNSKQAAKIVLGVAGIAWIGSCTSGLALGYYAANRVWDLVSIFNQCRDPNPVRVAC